MARYTNNNALSDGTSNLNYLVSPALMPVLEKIKPEHVEKTFGPGDERVLDLGAGYEDPEWYWKSSDGCVFGIGWRWGRARLRGGRISLNHPSHDQANEFLQFIINKLQF